MSRPTLVVGIPRSGTTWVARVLARTDGAVYLEEPDNHFRRPYAFRSKRRMGRGEYPAIAAGDVVEDYETLWRHALTAEPGRVGSRERARRRVAERLLASAKAAEVSAAIAERSPTSARLRLVERLALPERPPFGGAHLVVKSVYAPLAVEWIADRFRPKVVVVIRHPLNVVSSWSSLGWLERTHDDMLDELDRRAQLGLAGAFGVEPPGSDDSPFARAAWLAGALTCELVATADRHPDWHVVSHEQLSERAHEQLAALADRLGLRWTPEVDAMLDDLDRPGSGFEIAREKRDLADVWRRRLTPEQAQAALRVLERFPTESWTRPLTPR